jgi:hypothetical protein
MPVNNPRPVPTSAASIWPNRRWPWPGWKARSANRSTNTTSGRARNSLARAPRNTVLPNTLKTGAEDRARRHAELPGRGARGKLYGSLVLTVTIKSDGQVHGSTSIAHPVTRCLMMRRAVSCRWRRLMLPSRRTSGAIPTFSKLPAPGTLRRAISPERQMTDRCQYCVFGNPIAHSKSPAITRQICCEQCSEDMRYEALLAPLDGFADSVRDFIAAGGRGANVTVPFKEEAFRLCDRAACALSVPGRSIR